MFKYKTSPQIARKIYLNDYDNLLRFISYYYQIKLTKSLAPKTVLEIGIGNGLYSDSIKRYGIDITTCDFDKKLKPDYVADVRNLPFKKESFDLIALFEVLEHIPFNDVDKALNELHNITKKYVILSLPYYSATFEFTIRFPFIGRLFKKSFFDLFIRLPFLVKDKKFNGEHYWEIGWKSYPLERIRKLFHKNAFRIIKEIRPILNTSHYFFILEKMD